MLVQDDTLRLDAVELESLNSFEEEPVWKAIVNELLIRQATQRMELESGFYEDSKGSLEPMSNEQTMFIRGELSNMRWLLNLIKVRREILIAQNEENKNV